MNTTILFVLKLVLLFSCTFITQGAKRKTVVYFDKFKIENHNKELLKIDYQINCTSDNVSTIYANIEIAEDLEYFNGTFNLSIRNGGKYISFGNQDIDCNGMGMIYNHYLIQMIAVSLRSYSNIPLSCPYKKNKLYYINGFKIVTDIVPSYFPEVSFTTDAKIYFNQRLSLRIGTEGHLSRK
ncbi:uncharacterized protein LOC133835372 [Drosophila sulfurigaster albostrigata]|uniref:uncharacterized protein LOC133835372 n=1 Tax=Drosophila sulfurigaster albostrigata TaxID=89887 RepID=UPI002D21A79A|nr:uncharacterized protein LOC133835372 [Drosophila sulfurigaster albostrigata]